MLQIVVQCVKFSIIYVFISVKSEHAAHKYINESVYTQYNESNLVSRPIVHQHTNKKASMDTSVHLTAPLVLRVHACVHKYTNEDEGWRSIQVCACSPP